MSGRFEDLEVWQFAMQFVYSIYNVTSHFPSDERFGLTSQMRRAAVSIPSNIAEGKGRKTKKDMAVFLCHARGSVYELQTQLLIANHLRYISNSDLGNLKGELDRIGRMLSGLLSFATSSPAHSSEH